MNFIGLPPWLSLLFSRQKKSPERGFLRRAKVLSRQDADPLSFLVEPIIEDNAVDLGEQRKVPAHAHVLTRVDAGAELPDNDISRPHGLTAENLYPSSLSLAVSSVTGTPAGLFMCHY